MIIDLFMGWNIKRTSLLRREGLIVEGFATVGTRAKYFTINIGDRIGPDYGKDQLFLELYHNNNFEVFVHDPRFFTLNYIPVALPMLHCAASVNTTESHYYTMIATEVEELNLPQDPCNEDETYNFQVFILLLAIPKLSESQACVSKSITDILGCKSKWEPLAGDTTLPNCTTISQFR